MNLSKNNFNAIVWIRYILAIGGRRIYGYLNVWMAKLVIGWMDGLEIVCPDNDQNNHLATIIISIEQWLVNPTETRHFILFIRTLFFSKETTTKWNQKIFFSGTGKRKCKKSDNKKIIIPRQWKTTKKKFRTNWIKNRFHFQLPVVLFIFILQQ